MARPMDMARSRGVSTLQDGADKEGIKDEVRDLTRLERSWKDAGDCFGSDRWETSWGRTNRSSSRWAKE